MTNTHYQRFYYEKIKVRNPEDPREVNYESNKANSALAQTAHTVFNLTQSLSSTWEKDLDLSKFSTKDKKSSLKVLNNLNLKESSA